MLKVRVSGEVDNINRFLKQLNGVKGLKINDDNRLYPNQYSGFLRKYIEVSLLEVGTDETKK